MTRIYSYLTGLFLTGAVGVLNLSALGDPPPQVHLPAQPVPPKSTSKAALLRTIQQLPLSFESNQGQTNSRVRFLARTNDTTLFLTPSEAVFSMTMGPTYSFGERTTQRQDRKTGTEAGKSVRVALRMQMVGANPKAKTLTQQPLAGRINYLLGKDSRKWHTGVPTFGKVAFQGVYPGVDLVYYGNQQHLEYDFVVASHADPKQILLHFAGVRDVRVDTTGALVIRAQGRELQWKKPVVYQQDGTGKHPIAARFRLKRLPRGKTCVCFALGQYDAARPLVIDPILLYSTLLGDDTPVSLRAATIKVDAQGNAYVTGQADAPDFPTTAGAYQPTYAGGADSGGGGDAFIAKLNPTGTALVYATFLGGHTSDDKGIGLAIDSSGSAYVTGIAQSTDFPTTPGAFQQQYPHSLFFSGFIAKLDPTGATLVYSTYLGGNRGDAPYCIALDSSGDAFVAGGALSTNFPTTAGAFQTTSHGSASYVVKLNPTGTGLLYSTFLGGTGGTTSSDIAYGIAVDKDGNAFVTGQTATFDFPTTSGVLQTVNHVPSGSKDTTCYVTKVNATGTALLYSTFLGGSGSDYSRAVAIDSDGDAYVTGWATSADFPTTPGAFQTAPAGQFVAKLNPSASALLYSTFLRSSGEAQGFVGGIALDTNRNAYVVGSTTFSDFPTTIGAVQRAKAPLLQQIGFLTKLNATGDAVLYSTYLGGGGASASLKGDFPLSVALDNNNAVYITGATYSSDFPTTPGAFKTTNALSAGRSIAFVTKLAAIPIFPDLNNDGSADLLLQNPVTGEIGSWFMQGATKVGGASFSLTPPADFALVGVGDFNGDGSSTLVLQSKTTNQIAFWFTSGTNHSTIPGGHFVNTSPDAAWKVVGVGDFNGDSKSDLVFQNQSTGQIVVWFMNGYVVTGGVLLPYSPVAGWRLAGVGDLNADGFTDLLFQNQTSGQLAVWYLQGTSYVSGTVLTGVPGSGWSVAGVGDYNGDGFADLLFQNQTSNQAAVWYLQNGNFAGGDVLSLTPPSGWKIVGPR